MSERNARLTEQIVAAVKGFVGRAAAELRKEIDSLKQVVSALPPPEQLKGAPGKDAVIDFAALQAAARQAVADMPRPQDGKSIDVNEVRSMLQAMVDALPRPQDGKSVDPAAVRGMVEEAVTARVALLPPPAPGRDGKDVPLEAVKALVDMAVADRVAALPRAEPGRDGRDVDMGEVRALIETLVKAIPPPRDGRDVDDAAVQRQVEGIAQSVLPALVNKAFSDAEEGLVARAAGQVPIIPPQKGEDGEPGKDGQDGLSIDDFDIELKDGRTLVVKIRGGDRVIEREVKLVGLPVDRELFQAGRAYEKGDMVTYGGSIWLAKCDTTEPPKGQSDSWQLRVKGTK